MMNLNINLKELQERLESVEKHDQVPFSHEIWRKAFHLVSLSIPIIYSFVTREFALIILFIISIIAIIIDILIKQENVVQEMVFRFFGKIFRKYETNQFVLNGATWMLISAFLNVLLFPKVITIVSFYVLVISDAIAALIGKRFGKTRFLNKSLEGSITFLLSGIFVVIVFGNLVNAPFLFFIFAVGGVIFATFVEASSAFLHIDDNLGVPFAISTFLWVGAIISSHFSQNYIDLLK